MALTTNMVEQLAEWCLKSDALADIRATARRDFFGYDEPGEPNYMEGAGEVTSRERRFLGWFALTFKLPDGRCPAELATVAVLSGDDLTSAIDSIKGSRYVLAMVIVEELNKWLGLAMNIWNNTPQPDRGGKSAFEINRDYDEQGPKV